MAQVATAMSAKKSDTPEYVSVKIRRDVLAVVKAASALKEQAVQDWLSDIADGIAREQLAEHSRKPRPKSAD